METRAVRSLLFAILIELFALVVNASAPQDVFLPFFLSFTRTALTFLIGLSGLLVGANAWYQARLPHVMTEEEAES